MVIKQSVKNVIYKLKMYLWLAKFKILFTCEFYKNP